MRENARTRGRQHCLCHVWNVVYYSAKGHMYIFTVISWVVDAVGHVKSYFVVCRSYFTHKLTRPSCRVAHKYGLVMEVVTICEGAKHVVETVT